MSNSYYTLAPQTPRIKVGNVVTFGILISQRQASNDYVDIGMIPSDVAPSAWCYYSPNPNNAATILAIGSNGTIRLKGQLSAGVYLTITYCR